MLAVSFTQLRTSMMCTTFSLRQTYYLQNAVQHSEPFQRAKHHISMDRSQSTNAALEQQLATTDHIASRANYNWRDGHRLLFRTATLGEGFADTSGVAALAFTTLLDLPLAFAGVVGACVTIVSAAVSMGFDGVLPRLPAGLAAIVSALGVLTAASLGTTFFAAAFSLATGVLVLFTAALALFTGVLVLFAAALSLVTGVLALLAEAFSARTGMLFAAAFAGVAVVLFTTAFAAATGVLPPFADAFLGTGTAVSFGEALALAATAGATTGVLALTTGFATALAELALPGFCAACDLDVATGLGAGAAGLFAFGVLPAGADGDSDCFCCFRFACTQEHCELLLEHHRVMDSC